METNQLNEIISERTENTKIYDLGGKERRAEISGGFIHYKDDYSNPNEQWKDIDLTWKNNKIDKAPYILEVKDLEIKFTSKKTGTVQTLTLGKIGLNKSQGHIPWNFVGGQATWKNAASDTDVVIEAYPEGVKFKRILKNKNAPLSAEFIHSKVVGKKDDLVMRVKARDADGKPLKTTKSDVAGKLTESLHNSIDLDKAKFPIEIDPDTTIQPSAKDNFFNQNAGTTNYGGDDYFWLGKSGPDVTRFILNFDASAVSGTVSTATLSVYVHNYDWGSPEGETAYAYKITRDDWTEAGSSWTNYKASTAWTAGGGDYVTSSPAGGSHVFNATTAEWKTWSIVALVQDAVDSVSGSVNILVLKGNESLSTGVRAWSSEYAADTSLRPKLYIEYSGAAAAAAGNAPMMGTSW